MHHGPAPKLGERTSTTTCDGRKRCVDLPMSSSIVEVLRAISSALEGAGEGWYLFGAQAALLRGSRRLTADIDITIVPGELSETDLIERMTHNGFSVRVPDADDFVGRTRVLPVVHDATHMPVDVVVGSAGLEQLFLQHSEVIVLDGVRVPVPLAEHLVVMKLLAGRPTDLEDATSMARVGVDLDAVEALASTIAEGLGEDDILQALKELRRRLDPS